MITPEFLEYKLNLLQTNLDLQESILRDIVRRILKTDLCLTDTAAWQAEKLQGAGKVYDDLIQDISKAAGVTAREIKGIFADAEAEIFNYDDTLLRDAGMNPVGFKNLSPAMKQTWDAALKKTCTEAENLTKTTAITSQNLYIQACDLAHMQVASGAFDYQTAIKNAIRQAANQGVSVVYASGWVSSVDAAIRRSVLTGVNQTAGTLQMMRAEEFALDIMELTAHWGARPEHADWQGGLVSMSGARGYLSLTDIGYGEVTGFMGANCRHNWHLFWPGISTPAYTGEQLSGFKNATVTYDGAQMPAAIAIQKQRGMERAVRRTKRELVMYDEAAKNGQDMQAAFSQASVKLKQQEERIQDFCKQTGLSRDRFREQMFAEKTENGIRGFGKRTAQKAVWADRKLTKQATDGILQRTKHIEVPDVHYIGKIDRNIYKCVTKDIVTDDVIITDERIRHIKERHPNDFERYCFYLKEIVEEPEFIIEANKENSALILKSFSDGVDVFKGVLKLLTSMDDQGFKNSIITFMKIDNKEWNRLLKNKKILYKKE